MVLQGREVSDWKDISVEELPGFYGEKGEVNEEEK